MNSQSSLNPHDVPQVLTCRNYRTRPMLSRSAFSLFFFVVSSLATIQYTVTSHSWPKGTGHNISWTAKCHRLCHIYMYIYTCHDYIGVLHLRCYIIMRVYNVHGGIKHAKQPLTTTNKDCTIFAHGRAQW